ncbi:MAG TPA: serine/threonine-protein kinase [Terriglobales bacterium]|nr:serine/threonine-protein kinase [Terriglobales bacterium]
MRTHVNPGEQLDHYRIGEVLTHTPVASIFRATDASTEQPVLIKVPQPELETDPVFADRFQREQEIAKSFNHRGLLKALNDGLQSRPYIVMESFDGQPLRQLLLTQKKLPSVRAQKITIGLCDVLEYVENHGVAHRDIRPENILVGADDRIKLINFGTAAMMGARRITFANLAQSVGVSDYISPEELGGKRGDARSDIFAVGVVLYEMLTGKTPFQGVDPFDRLEKHPMPPSELESGISPQLQEVIFRALEPKPRDRYANANQMATDLRQLDRVVLKNRPKSQDVKRPANKALMYSAIALVPIVIFVLLLYFAHR